MTTSEELPALVPPGTFTFTDDHRLVVDSQVVASKVRRKRMSPSTMNALSNGGCPARFAAEKILPQEPDPFSPGNIGTLAHSVLEELYGLDASQRTPEMAMTLAIDHAAGVDLGCGSDATEAELRVRRSLLLTDVCNAYRGIFDIEEPSEIEPLHLEMRLEGAEIDGIPLTGFVDRLDRGSDEGSVRVIDYKTGKFKKASSMFGDDYGDQLRIYSLGVAACLDAEVESASLLFTKESKARKVAMSKPYIRETKRKFVRAWEELNEYCDDATFPTSVTGLCAYCPLVNACPAAQGAGKSSRIDAPHPVSLGLDIPVRTPEPDTPDLEAIRKAEPGAHSTAEPETATSGETVTAAHATPWPEDKAWEEVVKGRLNPNSYAAQAAVGVSVYAMRKIHEAGQPVRPSSIRAVASALQAILAGAMNRLGDYDEPDWQAGLNARLRAAVYGVIDELHPIPLAGQDGQPAKAAVWQSWIERVTGNAVALLQVAEALYDGQIDDDEYLRLAAAEDDSPAADEPDEDEDDEDDYEDDYEDEEADDDEDYDEAEPLEPDDFDDMIDGF